MKWSRRILVLSLTAATLAAGQTPQRQSNEALIAHAKSLELNTPYTPISCGRLQAGSLHRRNL